MTSKRQFIPLRRRSASERTDYVVLIAALALNFGASFSIPAYSAYSMIGLAAIGIAYAVSVLVSHWSLKIRSSLRYAACPIGHAEVIFVYYPRPKGSDVTVTSRSEFCNAMKCTRSGETYILHHMRRFTYDADTKRFTKLVLPEYVPSKHGLSAEVVQQRLDLYGKNMYVIPVPEFWPLFQQHLLAPFMVFQLFCILLWVLDEYWYYSLFTLGMLMLMESVVVKQRQRNLMQMRSVACKAPVELSTIRDGKWNTISSVNLVPGDTVTLPSTLSHLPADLVLLEGSAIVSEALLTGESKPLLKNPGDTLYAGTQLLACPKKATAGVAKTGFETAQGKLIRKICFASDTSRLESKESYVFLFLLFILACIAAAYLLTVREWTYDTLLHCVMILTTVVPPELPMELSLAVNHSLLMLAKDSKIFCTEPARIPFAGKIELCAFDKTGTLTADDMHVHDVFYADEHATTATLALRVLKHCHSLVTLPDKGDQLMGDPMEVSAHAYAVEKAPKDKSGFKLTATYPFSSELRRSSVVISSVEDPLHRLLLVKGAPETLFEMCVSEDKKDKAALAACEVKFKEYTSKGARVLALAYRQLSSDEHVSSSPDGRDPLEKHLHLCGLIAFMSPLKPHAQETITALQDAGIHCIMITGDNANTARAVGLQCGIAVGLAPKNLSSNTEGASSHVLSGENIETHEALATIVRKRYEQITVYARMSPKQKEVIVTTIKAALGDAHCVLYCGDGTNDVGALKAAHIGIAILSADLPQSQGASSNAAASGATASSPGGSAPSSASASATTATTSAPIVPAVRTKRPPPKSFAEMRQQMAEMRKEMEAQMQQEQQAIAQFGDASIAAPFTSKRSSIQCALDIVRHGRCTLSTTLQIYSILAIQCLLNAYTLSVLQLRGLKFKDRQLTVSSLFIAIGFFMMSRPNPTKKLARARPHTSIFEPYFVLSILGQFIIHLSHMVFLAYALLPSDYDPPEFSMTPSYPEEGVEEVTHPDIDMLATVLFPFTCIVNLVTFWVNYIGEPHMQSLKDNKPFMYLMAIAVFFFGSAALNMSPDVNEMMQLTPLPESVDGWLAAGRAQHRWWQTSLWQWMSAGQWSVHSMCVAVIASDVFLAFTWDRLWRLIFKR